MNFPQAFTQHPASVGETYAEHMRHAGGFGLAMLVGGLACLVHAAFPFLCKRTGSETVARLHDRMIVNRVRSTAAASVAASIAASVASGSVAAPQSAAQRP